MIASLTVVSVVQFSRILGHVIATARDLVVLLIATGSHDNGTGARRAAIAVSAVHLVLFDAFLLLHSPVLEPDLDLGLVQTKTRRDLDPTCPRQVLVEVELLFQFGQLFVGEIRAAEIRRMQLLMMMMVLMMRMVMVMWRRRRQTWNER